MVAPAAIGLAVVRAAVRRLIHHDGRALPIYCELHVYGPPTEVITAELIQRLYDVPVDVQIDRFGHPHVRTIRYQAEDDAVPKGTAPQGTAGIAS